MPTKANNDRKRERAHRQQAGKCFYCSEFIGIYPASKGNPVLEHYIPRHKGGTKTVLACQPCDKKKGMITGPDFEKLVNKYLTDGKLTERGKQLLAMECKAINIQLQREYSPPLLKPFRGSVQIEPIRVVPLPSQEGQFGLPGNSGRDAFQRKWAELFGPDPIAEPKEEA